MSLNTLQSVTELAINQLKTLADKHPGNIVFSTSLGQEDQVITDMIARHDLQIQLFSLDTGRLFSETYELFDRTRSRYQLPIKVYFPDADKIEAFVNEKGLNSFYESVENRKACCSIRKVLPLKRALAGNEIWVTGLRAGQSQARQELPQEEWDEANQITKFHPLLHWSLDQVQNYLDTYKVPYNSLHKKGFISIGCAPCTRAIEPGEDPRAGRWWWEQSQKECGLHAK